MGPTAEDFHEIFGVGSDPTKLAAIDLAGTSLAAIQALHRLALDQAEAINMLKAKVYELLSLESDIEQRISDLAKKH